LQYSNTCPSWFSTQTTPILDPWLTEQHMVEAEISDRQGIATGREGVTGTDPLVPGVEQISSGIGSSATERGLSKISYVS
jgi:hypothetical protein